MTKIFIAILLLCYSLFAHCFAADERSQNILDQRDIYPLPALSLQDPDLPAIMAPSKGRRYTTQAELDQITNKKIAAPGVKSGAMQEKQP